MPYERHERGCGCDRCVKRREYAKARYHAQKNGETFTQERAVRGPNRKGKRSDLRLPQPSGPTGRFLYTEDTGESVIHWMPKEEEWWVCPQCGAEFVKKDTGWVLERYT